MTAMRARDRKIDGMLQMKQESNLSGPGLAVRGRKASHRHSLECWVGECELKAEMDLPVANLEFMNLYF